MVKTILSQPSFSTSLTNSLQSVDSPTLSKIEKDSGGPTDPFTHVSTQILSVMHLDLGISYDSENKYSSLASRMEKKLEQEREEREHELQLEGEYHGKTYELRTGKDADRRKLTEGSYSHSHSHATDYSTTSFGGSYTSDEGDGDVGDEGGDEGVGEGGENEIDLPGSYHGKSYGSRSDSYSTAGEHSYRSYRPSDASASEDEV